MTFLYRLFKKDSESRDGVIIVTSWLGIIINLFIATLKIVVGLLAASIAIISEGANNATDVLSSVMTLIGMKIASKKPDEKHPFGYGRIEYFASFLISTFIITTGVQVLISSTKLAINPEPIDISYVSLIAVAFSAIIKFFLGIYTIKMGEKADSTALKAVGIEGRNDSFFSIITIISSLIYLFYHYSIDAYVGIFMSLVIIKNGYDVLSNTLSELIGRPGKKELADKLYEEIRSTKGVINAVDMMLHNYGPNRYSASVNVEIAQDKTIGEAYTFLHQLQLQIMHKYNVVTVFGIYAVDNKNKDLNELKGHIAKFIATHEHLRSYHAVYIDPTSDRIYFDLVVGYGLKDWEALRAELSEYIRKLYPNKKLELTIETEFV